MNEPLKIGGLALQSPVWLAPMAGYTDLPFRVGIRSLGGLGLAFTEMLSPETLLHGRPSSVNSLVATGPEDQPLGYQVYGKDPDLVARAAKWVEARGAALVDINMGCPQKQLSAKGRGAGLLRTPDLAVRIAQRVRESVRIPLTVKLRLGWDNTETAAELAVRFEELGVDAVTVHGRTRAQGFSGTVNLDAIRKVVESVKRIPVIANGDVVSVATAREMFERTKCAGIMLGREPLKNPWLIRDIARDLRGEAPLPPPAIVERVEFMTQHFERMLAFSGEAVAVIRFRKWIRLYLRGIPIERALLARLMQITTAADWRREVPRALGGA